MADVDPYERLGIPCGSSVEEIRSAYRQQIKKCHPDLFTDPEKRKLAQEETVRLNLAYEEALEISSRNLGALPLLSLEEAKTAARRQMDMKQNDKALRQLHRADRKDGEWFFLEGDIFMQLKQYEKANASYREAIHREPDNNHFREGALRAAAALRKKQGIKKIIRGWFGK